jgi:two-component system, OmpR family, sensor histidine kinase MtrB
MARDGGAGPAMELSRVLVVWQARLRRRLRGLARYPSGALLLRVLRGIRSRWRRSLQLRVVTATMLLGTVVVFAVGSILLAGIWNGLAKSRLDVAFGQQKQVTDTIRDTMDNVVATDQDQALKDLYGISKAAVTANRGATVMIPIEQAQSTQTPISPQTFGGVEVSDLPTDLRDQVVRAEGGQKGRRFSLTVLEDGHRRSVPAVAVGSVVDTVAAGPAEFYTVFRLDQERATLRLVQRTFVIGGIALVVLVGAVALVVTRQVVAPVRQAARTAEELASGLLDRRMRVRGQDDLARLARAFNEMAASLERQIHRLEELSRVQRRFVSDVSHELRTPLTTIRMASEVIHESRHEFAPATARSAELLQTQLDRFEALLGDLLEISRFDAGAAVLDVEPADLREIVSRVLDGLSPLADRKAVRLVTRMPAAPCLAEVDSRRVERVVRNLVANAIEHGEGRPVEVTVVTGEDAVAIGVLDHGVGLKPGEQQMVFNRFWRADPARARTTGGTGLGLAIALEDAHLHGGWLQVWGEAGVGANFRLTLPRRAGITLTGSPMPLVPFPAGDGTPRPDPDLDVAPADQVPGQVPAGGGL